MSKLQTPGVPSLPDNIDEAIRKTFAADPLGKHILERLLLYGVPRQTWDIYRLRLAIMAGGFQVTDMEILRFFTRLERLGVGTVVYKNPSRVNEHHKFRLKFPMPFVIESAKRAFESQTKVPASQKALEPKAKPQPNVGGERVVLCRIAGRTVRVRVPADLTVEMAEEIGATLIEHAQALESGEIV